LFARVDSRKQEEHQMEKNAAEIFRPANVLGGFTCRQSELPRCKIAQPNQFDKELNPNSQQESTLAKQ
jgi:hypothetical protein